MSIMHALPSGFVIRDTRRRSCAVCVRSSGGCRMPIFMLSDFLKVWIVTSGRRWHRYSSMTGSNEKCTFSH